MKSHMAVQSFATARNRKVELFIEFILEFFLEKLSREGSIQSHLVEAQKHYNSPIASDIWDHFVSLKSSDGGVRRELWCQTTCYKGNRQNKREPNKTYEVRETLVEAISLREHRKNSEIELSTIHFTVGPKEYTYDWFAPAKEKTFDLSIYLNTTQENVFDAIEACFIDAVTELQAKQNFSDILKQETELAAEIRQVLSRLHEWYHLGCPRQKVADEQYGLVVNELGDRCDEIEAVIKRAADGGQNIKKRCNEVVHGAVDEDPVVALTVERLLSRKPFIGKVQTILKDWDAFCRKASSSILKADNLDIAIRNLWQAPDLDRLIYRRLLMRLGRKEAANYIQDLEIEGLTEHNLYAGKHSAVQVSGVVGLIRKEQRFNSIDDLIQKICSQDAKTFLRNALWFEARNGATLTPSFDYVAFSLEQHGYEVVAASKTELNVVGFHDQLVGSNANVNSYSNLRAVKNQDGQIVALLKGKFFNGPEFPRRCKEEAYVALTLKYKYVDRKFSKSLKIPIIMFVDMAQEYSPPESAVRRLQAFGWNIAFSVEDVLRIISND